LEYDFVVSPGADPDVIALNFSGADDISIADDGALVVKAGDTEIRQPAPFIYQEVNGTRQQVAGSFSLSTQHSALSTDGCATGYCLLTTVYFDVGAYDPSRPLVIDPLVLGYSTYLGGGGFIDGAYAIAADDNGHAYVTGETRSFKFPFTDGAFDESYNDGGNDAFVAKLNEDGSGLVYATYLGGTDSEQGGGITVDAAGNAYIIGGTRSTDFPTTSGAFSETHNSGGNKNDVFVTKLSADGSALVFSTFLGGRNGEVGYGIGVDESGYVYVSGGTASPNFPVTPGAFSTSYNGGGDTYIAKFTPDGGALVFATYLGGSGSDGARGMAFDASGNVFVTGGTDSTDFSTTLGAFDQTYNGGDADAFIVKLSADGSALIYSTFLGGSDSVGDGAGDIEVDSAGNAYVIGGTQSDDFPVTPGAFDTVHEVGSGNDGFATKLNATGSTLIYSTYLGGGSSSAQAVELDTAGSAYITGTAISGFQTTPDAFQKTYGGGGDSFLMKLNPAGSALIYSSYLGGSNDDRAWAIALDDGGSAYVSGDTTSGDFPTTLNALKRRNRPSTMDGFVTKFAEL
jgi:hypothetical protein